MTKQITIINPDDSEREICAQELGENGLPPVKTMKAIVGGYIELVLVLRADLTDRNEYTMMVVNEEGLLNDLPHNERATEIYLANVRRAFPHDPEPWRAAEEGARRRAETIGATYIDLTPPQHQGKKPSIRGTVIWFDGYTCDELLEMGL